MTIQEYSPVRVRQLLRSTDAYDGWGCNQRPPRVGDVGTVVDVMGTRGLPSSHVYIVECCDPEGVPLWLGEFSAEEIEAIGG